MVAGDLIEGEQIHILNLDTRDAVVTHVTRGDEGEVILCGEISEFGRIGSRLLIESYAWIDDGEWEVFRPRHVTLNANNRIEKEVEVVG